MFSFHLKDVPFSVVHAKNTSSSTCQEAKKPIESDAKEEKFTDLGDSTYVYSAYFDNRKQLVRIYGATTYYYKPHTPIFCLLWYEDDHHPDVTIGQLVPWDDHK